MGLTELPLAELTLGILPVLRGVLAVLRLVLAILRCVLPVLRGVLAVLRPILIARVAVVVVRWRNWGSAHDYPFVSTSKIGCWDQHLALPPAWSCFHRTALLPRCGSFLHLPF
jgi:hypothetical protein